MGSDTIRIAGPAEEPVALGKAKSHLRVTHSDDDDDIEDLISAARQIAENRRGLVFVTSTFEQHLDAWPEGDKPITLSMHPVIAVAKIEYVDAAGVTQTLDADTYHVSKSDRRRTRVDLACNEAWPGLYSGEKQAVKITYTAGFGGAAAVPNALKVAVKHIVSELYDRRQDAAPGAPLHDVPIKSSNILRLFEPVEV